MVKERKTLGEVLFSPISDETRKRQDIERTRKEKETGEIFSLKNSNPELFRKKFRDLYAERVLEIMTNPEISYIYNANEVAEIVEMIKRGEKIKSDNFTAGAFVALGQDFRMTPDEIQQLRGEYFQ